MLPYPSLTSPKANQRRHRRQDLGVCLLVHRQFRRQRSLPMTIRALVEKGLNPALTPDNEQADSSEFANNIHSLSHETIKKQGQSIGKVADAHAHFANSPHRFPPTFK